MHFLNDTTTIGILASTIIYCFLSGLLPFLNTELYLLSVTAISPDYLVFPLLCIAVTVQMLSKSLIYLAGSGVISLPIQKYEAKLKVIQSKFERGKRRLDLLIFISATAGTPPFFITTILCGVMRVPFYKFFIAGTLGSLLKFSIPIYFPHFIKNIF